MQTFLPYSDFNRSAEMLHDKHLRNQVNEAFVVLKSCISPHGGWPNHSVTRQWRGYEGALMEYIDAILSEMEKRFDPGSTIAMRSKMEMFREIFPRVGDNFRTPPWLGDADFHRVHRGNLVRKAQHYRDIWPDEEPCKSIEIKYAVEAVVGTLTTNWSGK